jgi:hypothetical protein
MEEGGCNLNEKIRRALPVLYLLLAFIAGCLFAGFFFNRQRPISIGELDKRYADEHARAAETIGRLEVELNRERELNRQLLEHNSRARDIANELANTTERNVRSLQDAVGLNAEIRKKLKILEDFYAGRDTGNGGN